MAKLKEFLAEDWNEIPTQLSKGLTAIYGKCSIEIVATRGWHKQLIGLGGQLTDH